LDGATRGYSREVVGRSLWRKYDAKLDHAPVLALTGMQETQMLGTGYQQEVHLEKLFIDVAEYNQLVMVPAQIPTVVDLAVRHALARPGVAHLTFPNDVQVAAADAQPWPSVGPAVIKPTAPVHFQPPGTPRRSDLERAAEALNAGSRVVMLVGAGALHARAEVLATAAALASPKVEYQQAKEFAKAFGARPTGPPSPPPCSRTRFASSGRLVPQVEPARGVA
jgi:pyruvate dehydrogenase (quinone)/pyruvate oxidase